jgi:hypothetical protein
MTDIVERLRAELTAAMSPARRALIAEAADEIGRLKAEHDDYVIRANANVCEFNREIERLRNEMGDELLLEENKLMRAALRKQSDEIERLRARVADLEDQLLQALGERPMRREGI